MGRRCDVPEKEVRAELYIREGVPSTLSSLFYLSHHQQTILKTTILPKTLNLTNHQNQIIHHGCRRQLCMSSLSICFYIASTNKIYNNRSSPSSGPLVMPSWPLSAAWATSSTPSSTPSSPSSASSSASSPAATAVARGAPAVRGRLGGVGCRGNYCLETLKGEYMEAGVGSGWFSKELKS